MDASATLLHGVIPLHLFCRADSIDVVSQQIKEEGRPAVDRWLNVLKAGGTMKPLDLLKHAGVDMSTDQPIRRAVTYVGTLVDELEKLYDKKEDRPD